MALNGKVILVTGAAQGIGRGIALRLAKEGADIALVDLKADKLSDVAKEIEALGRKVTTFAADISNRDGVWALRINFGQGYRVYYSIENEFIILLLVGGNKSTQQADIDKAVNYLEDYHVRMKNDQ
ncbi:SDR family NAD(P)-dependent oxidoreductase [Proteus mirabilis]|uniref:type II toxin-antitoxin system RelE/ParE family toxin n=1 Tax=Proteus mirabilis TaxID=584 RepID=UPI0025789459|nr:type II toxin-antitoxin system RelE/ParE family toxin [Proteus mirabilis]MDM3774701.1 SDR family NAD(P)-dependent oxidoreductase [Proteus mirabilis]